jgi:hypothetical protein
MRKPMTDEKDVLFPEDQEFDPASIVHITAPARFPTKLEMKIARGVFMREVVETIGPLRAYMVIKVVEKMLLDKEEGMLMQLKSDATKEFQHRGGGKQDVFGASVSYRKTTKWTYPDDIMQDEATLNNIYLELAGRKKAAEIDGRATKMEVGDGGIVVSFK